MRYAVFSDLHGNYDAFEAVLADMEVQGVPTENMFCLGDLVGYGAEPGRCVDKIIELGIPCVAGNHDHACIDKLSIELFNSYARVSALWTRENTSDEHKAFLREQNFEMVTDQFHLVHGTPYAPEMFHYIQTLYDAQISLREMKRPICFIGHSHVPMVFLDTNPVSYVIANEIQVVDDMRFLINVGSVGQSRDEDPRAAYALYDTELSVVTIRRVEYDIDATAKKIRDAGLPEYLAARLYEGK